MKTLFNVTRAGLCAGLAVLALPAAATPLALTKSFEGNINIAGTQASVQSKNNGAKACELLASAGASLTLPPGSNVIAAILYWAGTGPVDTEVLLNGSKVTAPSDRRYSSSIDGLSYFAAAADVTTLVKGRSAFTFSGLDVSKADIYCAKQQKENAMVAGFSLAVVYAREGEPYRAVNVYEGLHAIKNSSVTVQMGDYVPPAVNTGLGRLAYIVWEGDKTGQQKGDSVSFAGEVLEAAPYVHKDDAFNSKSGANGDETSNGIDFDIVNLPSLPASPANAKAVFTTQDDRVLLGTAIAVLPAKPSDLSIKKTASGEFKTGNEIIYTLSVTNEGGRADSNVEVKDTLPDAVAFVSASGTDWTCSVLGKTVACKYGKPLAAGATASIQLKAKITGNGKITNTATVTGTADSVSGNNSSTAEGNAGGPQVGTNPFVFTVGECKDGEPITTSGDGACTLFTGPVVAGSTPEIYLTHALYGTAKAVSGAISLDVRYSLQCNNPEKGAGTIAVYAGKSLPACIDNGAVVSDTDGEAAKLELEAGKASKKATFSYADAGRVTLQMRDSAGNVARTTFISMPKNLSVVYRRVVDGAPNPPALDGFGFAEAGEPFQAIVSAYATDGKTILKNFGRESGEYALTNRLAVQAEQPNLLEAQDEWDGAGSVARTFVWNDVGTASLGIAFGAYLGAGKELDITAVPVGRFYPQYFETELTGGFPCLKRMACPAAAPGLITQAVFSKQKFDATVRAYGRNGLLLSYENKQDLIPRISLVAVSAPDKNGKALDKFVDGDPAANMARKLSYRLATAYDAKADDKASRDWTPPSAVYARAVAQEQRSAPGGGAVTVQISSLREKDSVEGGLMVVNGRLFVANTIGTPLAKTAVPLRAQYWSGMGWEQNSAVEQEQAVMGSVDFLKCRRSLRPPSATGDACDLGIVKLAGVEAGVKEVALPMLKNGKANLILAPVGDKSGNVDLFVNGEEYLPSTFGRVSFGSFKSPVIYVREMY